MDAFVFHPDRFHLRLLQFYLVASGFLVAALEICGKGLRYSKFAVPASQSCKKQFSSRVGMLISYLPAALISTIFFLYKLDVPSDKIDLSTTRNLSHDFQQQQPIQTSPRLLLYACAVSLQYWKRILEVLFVHQYSGSMEQQLSASFAVQYIMICGCPLYAQQIAENLTPPLLDLMWYGVPIYLVGMLGNFYHHYLLSSLRKRAPRTKYYAVPQNGLFLFVVCPHYLFEIVLFIGLALIGQTSTAFAQALGVTIALCARAQSTKYWYMKNLKGHPAHIKALIPFLF